MPFILIRPDEFREYARKRKKKDNVTFLPNIFPKKEEIPNDLEEIPPSQRANSWAHAYAHDSRSIKGTLILNENGMFYQPTAYDGKRLNLAPIPLNLPKEMTDRAGMGGKPMSAIVATNDYHDLTPIIDTEASNTTQWPVGKKEMRKELSISGKKIEGGMEAWFTGSPHPGEKQWSTSHLVRTATKFKIQVSFAAVYESMFGPSAKSLLNKGLGPETLMGLREKWEEHWGDNPPREAHGEWQSAMDWLSKNSRKFQTIGFSSYNRYNALPLPLQRIVDRDCPPQHPVNQSLVMLGMSCRKTALHCANKQLADKLNHAIKTFLTYEENRPRKDGKPGTGKKRSKAEKKFINEKITASVSYLILKIQDSDPDETDIMGKPMITDLHKLKADTKEITEYIGFMTYQAGNLWDIMEKKTQAQRLLEGQRPLRSRASKIRRSKEVREDTAGLMEHVFREFVKNPHGNGYRRRDNNDIISIPAQMMQLTGKEEFKLTPSTSCQKMADTIDRIDGMINEARVIEGRRVETEGTAIDATPQQKMIYQRFTQVFPHTEQPAPDAEIIKNINKNKNSDTSYNRRAPGQEEIQKACQHLPKGWTVEILKNKKDLYTEGKQMKHCVGGYEHPCANAEMTIVKLHPDKSDSPEIRHRSTIALQCSKEGAVYIQQNRGKNNREPSPENKRTANLLCTGMNKAIKTETKAKEKAPEKHNPGRQDRNIMMLVEMDRRIKPVIHKIMEVPDDQMSERFKNATMPKNGQQLMYVRCDEKMKPISSKILINHPDKPGETRFVEIRNLLSNSDYQANKIVEENIQKAIKGKLPKKGVMSLFKKNPPEDLAMMA